MGVFETAYAPGNPFSGKAEMFAETVGFAFTDEENGWFKTEIARLGRGVELWKVTSTGHEIELNETEKASCLIPSVGNVSVSTSSGEYAAETGEIMLFSPHRRKTRVTAASRQPYEALVILLGHESEALTAERRKLLRPGCIELVAGRDDSAVKGLREYTSYLGREFERPDSALACSRALDAVSVILEEYVIDITEDAGTDDAAGEALPDTFSLVCRAEELMRSRFEEHLLIVDVARKLGVGLRTLQIAFHKHRGYSPREALMGIRLDAARRRLFKAAPNENVSGIALDCGFTHFGRFSGAYQRRFGVLPSQDRKVSRAC